MGIPGLNSLDEPHTYFGSARDAVLGMDAAVQSRGWWFNREYTTLYPSAADGRVYVNTDVTKVRARATTTIPYRLLGRAVVGVSGAPVTSPIDVAIIRRLELDDLPEEAWQYILARAVEKFQLGFAADEAKSPIYAKNVKTTFADLHAEELRQLAAYPLFPVPTQTRNRLRTYGSDR